MQNQLALSLRLRDNASLQNYFSGRNAEAVEKLRQSIHDHGSDGAIFLWGGKGTGKTHLLQAVCHQAAEMDLDTAYLPLAEMLEFPTEMLEGMENRACVCIDDVEAIAGNADWETALFDLYNRAFDRGTQLIFAAEKNIPQLGLHLADLSSRLAWGFVFQLHSLDDDEKLLALQLRAKQKGFALPENVGAYLLRHCPRDMAALFQLLDQLDVASLAAQRHLTVPFVKQLLDSTNSQPQASLF